MKEVSINDNITYPADSKTPTAFFLLAAVGIIASATGYFMLGEDKAQFFFSYLTRFTFVASIALGALFFVMLQHVTRSKWSVALRRIPEVLSANTWVLLLLFIPVFYGMHDLFHWTHEEAVATDPILLAKEPYLNIPFYLIRNVIFFAIWGFLGWKLFQVSKRMDENQNWGEQTLLRKISAPGIPIFAFTVAFASFDWLMSLDPHWFSTMWGVYYFAMSFQVFFPIVILIVMYLWKKGLVTESITMKHLGDAGKLLFGFTVFYAYIAFSQYLLIYYANIPEETLWFYHRFEGDWVYIAWLLLLGRFVLPFIVLLSKSAKSNIKVLKWLSVWLIAVHFIELYWIVMPTLHTHHTSFHWLDIATLLGLGGLFMGLFFNTLKKQSLIPTSDPHLNESLDNH